MRLIRNAAAVLSVFATLGLTACGYTINPYGVSPDNVKALKASEIKPVAVGTFTAANPGTNFIICRAAGPVDTPDNKPFETYVQNAFVDELKLAGLYDAQSPIVVQGVLQQLDFNSVIGVAHWVFRLSISSNRAQGFEVKSSYDFSTNWIADKACQQVAQAFAPAVQKLIADTVANPGFRALAQ